MFLLIEYLGVTVDKYRNNVRSKSRLISGDDLKIQAFEISTDEERMITMDVQRLA